MGVISVVIRSPQLNSAPLLPLDSHGQIQAKSSTVESRQANQEKRSREGLRSARRLQAEPTAVNHAALPASGWSP